MYNIVLKFYYYFYNKQPIHCQPLQTVHDNLSVLKLYECQGVCLGTVNLTVHKMTENKTVLQI